MCGILGWVGPDVDETLAPGIEPAMLKLKARGPDGQGNRFGHNWFLGHTRLAILDVTDCAAQPMTDGDGRWLVYNGEVYNFRELSAELAKLGHRIRSTGDAEVVLCALKQWGAEALCRFRGMFALCYLDQNKRELLLARDRFGVKPLLYSQVKNDLRFASTLSALRLLPGAESAVDAEASYLYFALGYVPAPHSMVRGVRKLMPGQYLAVRWNEDGVQTIAAKPYWSLAGIPPADSCHGAVKNVAREFSERLREAVNYRLISDVPVGSLLSSGLDSSLVTAVARSLHPDIPCFTMGFEEAAYDESPYAQKIADRLNVEWHRFYSRAADAPASVASLPDVYDEPFADPSAIPMVALCRSVSRRVKVALSGDGGDEAQAGYPWHRAMARAENVATRMGPLRKLAALGRILPQPSRYQLSVLAASDRIERWSRLRTGLTDKLCRWLPVEGACEFAPISDYFRRWSAPINNIPDSIDWSCRMDLLTYLPDDLLVKADRAGMRFGLELREPMLDHELIEWELQIPVSLRFDRHTRQGKLPSRALVAEKIGQSYFNRPKQGFTPPMVSWLEGPLQPLMREAISALEGRRLSPLALRQGCVSWSECRARLSDVHSQFSWRLLCFFLWCKSVAI